MLNNKQFTIIILVMISGIIIIASLLFVLLNQASYAYVKLGVDRSGAHLEIGDGLEKENQHSLNNDPEERV